MAENRAFTEKAIAQAQRGALGEPFTDALHEYLVKQGRIAWDDKRALFWVQPPNGPPQVAVWMMEAATKFEPRKD